MSTCPQKEIDILGIGASTLDRFIVVDHYQRDVRYNKLYLLPPMVEDL